MKNLSLVLLVIFLISLGSFFQQVTAQEKTKEEQEEDLKIQQKIDAQKKALVELEKSTGDAELQWMQKVGAGQHYEQYAEISLIKQTLTEQKIFTGFAQRDMVPFSLMNLILYLTDRLF